jgi:hypothetical protein
VPYFRRTGPSTFAPTEHVSGGWSATEQHVAPAFGLLTHLVEADRDARRDDGLLIGRLAFDVLGTIPVEEVTLGVEVRRPGRTIELVEATLSHAGRPAVLLRAWLMAPGETASVAGSDLPRIPPSDTMTDWDPTTVWPGGFIAAATVRREEDRPGRARYWVRSDVPLLDEPVSPTAQAVRLFDIANGMTVREPPSVVGFPNLDLTAHLFREPHGDEVGFDTTVSFGPDGRGVTSSVLHDGNGPFGTLAQLLTVRPVTPV